MEQKDSQNTKKATKNVIATLLVFFKEVSSQEASAEKLEEMSKEELNIFFLPNTRKKSRDNKKVCLDGTSKMLSSKKKIDIVNVIYGLSKYSK